MNTEGKVTYKYIVYIQFEESKKAYTFGSNVKYYTNDIVVVETVRGQELGKVCVPTVDFDASKVKGDIKPVLRKATPEDIKCKEENVERAKEAMKICHECVANLKLDMHLISSEYTLDRTKVIFTYVSDDRVDFRQLLKDLAQHLADIAGTKVIFDLPSEAERAGYSTATKALLDTQKIEQLGWKAGFDLEEGLSQTVEMMKEPRF